MALDWKHACWQITSKSRYQREAILHVSSDLTQQRRWMREAWHLSKSRTCHSATGLDWAANDQKKVGGSVFRPPGAGRRRPETTSGSVNMLAQRQWGQMSVLQCWHQTGIGMREPCDVVPKCGLETGQSSLARQRTLLLYASAPWRMGGQTAV